MFGRSNPRTMIFGSRMPRRFELLENSAQVAHAQSRVDYCRIGGVQLIDGVDLILLQRNPRRYNHGGSVEQFARNLING